MYYFTLNQAYVFAFSVYGGLIIGLIYDLLRLIRRVFHTKKILTIILDVLFWLLATSVGLLVLFLSSSGRMRFFPFLGYILGFAIYMVGVSSLFWWLVEFFQKKTKKLFQKKKKSTMINK